MGERKPWTQQQNQFLIQKINQNESLSEKQKLKWGGIAILLNQRFKDITRTGKQCRQRWHNQLNPNISKQEWSVDEQKKLFQFQKKLGNKWAQISYKLQGRTDNNVKNYFYSTLRKSLRKVNTFMCNNRTQLKNVKQFKQSSLSKILAVADHKFDKKINIKSNTAQNQAMQIKNLLIEISHIQPNQKKSYKIFFSLIQKIQDFNKTCKKKKGKRKQIIQDIKMQSEQIQQHQQNEENSQDSHNLKQNQLQKIQEGFDIGCLDQIQQPKDKGQGKGIKCRQRKVMQVTVNRQKFDDTMPRVSGLIGSNPLFQGFSNVDLLDEQPTPKSIGVLTRRVDSSNNGWFTDTMRDIKENTIKLVRNQSRFSNFSQVILKDQDADEIAFFKRQSSIKQFPPLQYEAFQFKKDSLLQNSMKFEPQMKKLRSFSRKDSQLNMVDEYNFLNNEQ